MQAIHTKYKNRSSCLGSNTKLYSKNRSNNTPTGIFSKISRLRSMFLFFSVILASMISETGSMIFATPVKSAEYDSKTREYVFSE